MKQVQLRKPGGLDNLQIIDSNIPNLREHEVLVKVKASSLNYHDLLVALGRIPTEDKRVPLSDCGGEIIKIGNKVSRWEVGNEVMSCCFPNWISGQPKPELLSFIGDNEDGYATEYIAIPESALTRTPSGWSALQSATLPCAGLTVWRALIDEGNLQAGDTVLVQGSGGVSVFALQLAKAKGANVIATSSSSEKLDKLSSLGADTVINYKENPEWGREVLSATQGQGVDHVVEVGGANTFGESIRSVKMGGHVALIGILGGASVNEILLPRIFLKQIRISGIAMASRASQEAMVDYLDNSSIRPIISHTFALESLTEAFKLQMSNGHFGKIGITVCN